MIHQRITLAVEGYKVVGRAWVCELYSYGLVFQIHS